MKRCARTAKAIFWLVTVLSALTAAASAQPKFEEFYDKDYGYWFRYPAGWALHKLPEGEAIGDIRAMLQGPSGSSFMVIVEKSGNTITRRDNEAAGERQARIEALISQTIEQVYKNVAQNIKAVAMTVGERRDISTDVAIKFYISTLDKMADGKPIIVAGIHAFPFGKDYAVNFIMSAVQEGIPTKEQETLIAVFNSFRLLGEGSAATSDKSAKPSGK